MVQPERGIAGTGIGVVVQAANGEVPARMDTLDCLEDGVEAAELGTRSDGPHDVCGLGLVAPDEGEVTPQAARVVVQTAVAVNGREGDRAEVHCIVHKRALVDTAAAGGWREAKIDAKG